MNGQGNKSQSAAQVLAWNQNNTQWNWSSKSKHLSFAWLFFSTITIW
jgi:hypothetical protein